MEGLQDFNFEKAHYLLMVVASASSYAVTQIVKPFWKSYFEEDKEKASSLTRLCAVVIGGVVGFSLTFKVVDLWLGVTAGAFNTLIVKVIKKKLGVNNDEPKSEPPKTLPNE